MADVEKKAVEGENIFKKDIYKFHEIQKGSIFSHKLVKQIIVDHDMNLVKSWECSCSLTFCEV